MHGSECVEGATEKAIDDHENDEQRRDAREEEPWKDPGSARGDRDERVESWQRFLGNEKPHTAVKLITVLHADDKAHDMRTMESAAACKNPCASEEYENYGNVDMWPANHDREGRQPW